MNPKELRELDAWLAEHTMKCKPVDMLRDLKDYTFLTSEDSGVLLLLPGNKKLQSFNPTTDPAATMVVLEKCAEKNIIEIDKRPDGFKVRSVVFPVCSGRAETLSLAICLFAKKLFTP